MIFIHVSDVFKHNENFFFFAKIQYYARLISRRTVLICQITKILNVPGLHIFLYIYIIYFFLM